MYIKEEKDDFYPHIRQFDSSRVTDNYTVISRDSVGEEYKGWLDSQLKSVKYFTKKYLSAKFPVKEMKTENTYYIKGGAK